MNNYYVPAQERVRSLMYNVFGWMSYALALTGLTSLYIYANPKIMAALVIRPGAFLAIALLQLVLVVALSAAVNRLSFSAALVIFTIYAVLTGVTVSSVFLVYTTSSIISTFLVASAMFGSMALYGAFTKADLTNLGSFLMMALWGMIIAMVVNIFLASPAVNYAVSMIGVVVFALFTAFDVQKIKAMAQYQLPEAASLAFALMLYLDFINLFLSLLNLMGDRKQ